ncbi:MAG: double-strand break repair protein AddB, partial [Rhodobacteraceae bacterium]|nr:double-strand break repair protein AddB [Paracoccaceae bacterium]
MFEGIEHRLFAVPVGADFPRALVRGLETRMAHAVPGDWARITLIVNTRRMQRRIKDLFAQGPARLLPRILLLTEVDHLLPQAPDGAGSTLQRRLELAQLIQKLSEQESALAPKAHVFDLADSLARLIDEMQGEGVSPETLLNLDVTGHSEYWDRTRAFVAIAADYLASRKLELDPEARQRRVIEMLEAHWTDTPPKHPIILVGSTGSRKSTQDLMVSLAAQSNGAVILPGYDPHIPAPVWARILNDETEDHPQYRLAKIAEAIGPSPAHIPAWNTDSPTDNVRHQTVSLALRPAPVTDAWIEEGPALGDTQAAMAGVTLLEAETPRAEATAIALRLRQAAEDGQTAALITPDRVLTRHVTAALDRWHILPDDSAGTPLHLSPPGRFLRHLAELWVRPLDAERLLTLLKHPLTHSGADRNQHQLNTQRFELRLRQDAVAYPGADHIRDLSQRAVSNDHPEREAIAAWGEWVANTLVLEPVSTFQPLSAWIDALRSWAERIASGPDGDATELWNKAAGQEALRCVCDLQDVAAHGGEMSARDFERLLTSVLTQSEVRDRDAPHPNIMIWGTIEARVQGADLVILGSLNDGVWPSAPDPDPWLNRALRKDAGLLAPERRIGLSAHDFQQAIAAPEVWITRSIRSEEAETVPSRWVNRLQNLLSGLPDQNGPEALEDMRARGAKWLDIGRAMETVDPVAKVLRPSPKFADIATLKSIRVTEVETLIRDPYALYARHWLRLRPLDPLVPEAEASLRGSLVHQVLEDFVRQSRDAPDHLTVDQFKAHVREVLATSVPWASIRALWIARLDRIADWFVRTEAQRQTKARPIAFEASGRLDLPATHAELRGRADRMDENKE